MENIYWHKKPRFRFLGDMNEKNISSGRNNAKSFK